MPCLIYSIGYVLQSQSRNLDNVLYSVYSIPSSQVIDKVCVRSFTFKKIFVLAKKKIQKC